MNRVFSLSFDNGVEFIAKIPFYIAGPKHFSTASEVATLDYLRTELGVRVPNVRAWCSRAESTPVGTEYIMYDKIPGVPLYQHETELPMEKDPYVDILPPIQSLESALARIYFSQIGSIYYKADVSESLRDRPLYDDMPLSANSARFCIGPTVNCEFWRGERATLDIDRGPWSDVHSYMFALAACARASISASPDPSTDDEYLRLISVYESMVPHIAPLRTEYILAHPDLHASNIITTETTDPCKITGIIDWQGALIAPYYAQLSTPPAFASEEFPVFDDTPEHGPELPEGVDDLPAKEKQLAHLAHRRLRRQWLYEVRMREYNPFLADHLYNLMTGVVAMRMVTYPGIHITRGRVEGLAFLQNSFLISRKVWNLSVGVDENGAPLVPCPLDISEADEQRISEECERVRLEVSMADEVLQSLQIPRDAEGMVGVDDYEAAKVAVEEARQAILGNATSQEERDRLERAWPLQDGKFSLMAERCC
ncbi:hypothetical protein M413DRAFT_387255 [Hebeloma cylindrosporum]|uniref:Altered inheritance of mitochondria protein 9, mitochondrial n=1 Tax=Hebeloma cylindrosporum TaxID=76867 RepID=A0A0C3C4D0_HEBCY|nr:hypothetical protein M413DRAFT_387255 [Hebeloma cylindrosporum h7]